MAAVSELLTIFRHPRIRKPMVRREPLPPDLVTGGASLTGRTILMDDGTVNEYGRKTQTGTYTIRTFPDYRAWAAARLK